MNECILSPGPENAKRRVLHQRHLFRSIDKCPGIIHVDGPCAVSPTATHPDDGKGK